MTTAIQNTPDKVKFRHNVLTVEQGLKDRVASGELVSDDSPLKHYFSPVDEKYGCCAYAREILLRKGSLVIGKIHKHQHLNIISKGKVTVFTEFGKKELEGPYVCFRNRTKTGCLCPRGYYLDNYTFNCP
jgi:hypothetical protein